MASSLGRRIFLAHMELTYRLGRRVTLAEFGELVARQLGKETPFSSAAVSRWESGDQAPGAEVIEAIAAVTHTDPGWISHGEKSAAPPPPRSGEFPRYEDRRQGQRRGKGRTGQAENATPADESTPAGGGRKRKRRQR